MSMPEFRAWPKTPRLFKDVTITEKIDGTNGAIHITEDGDVVAQSRKRLLTLDSDNFGFARWVYDHSDYLRNILGVGTHFGEWWGCGINRGYDCRPGERYFSLFNVNKWGHLREASPLDSLSVVPVLWTGEMDTAAVLDVAEKLQINGSEAKPGYMRPEGVCLFHSAGNSIFKYPFDKDDAPLIAWSDDIGPDIRPAPKRTLTQKFKEMFWLMA